MYVPEPTPKKPEITEVENKAYEKTKDFYSRHYQLKNDTSQKRRDLERHYNDANSMLRESSIELAIEHNENNRDKVFASQLAPNEQQKLFDQSSSYEEFYNRLNAKVAKNVKQHEKEVKKIDLFNPLTISVEEYCGESEVAYTLNHFRIETMREFCILENLKFSPLQLAEMFYFRNAYPIFVGNQQYYRDNNPYVKTTRDESTEIYNLFYVWIIKPFYDKNKKNYNSLEDCIVDVVRAFNLAPQMFMTQQEFFNFLTTYTHNNDIPIAMNCRIMYDTDYIYNIDDYDNNENSYTRLSPNKYMEAIEQLSEKIENKQTYLQSLDDKLQL